METTPKCERCNEKRTLNRYGKPAWHVCSGESFEAQEAKQAA